MKIFLILLLFLPILSRAETLNLKWNTLDTNNQNFWLTYGIKNSILSVSKNIGNTNRHTLNLKDGEEYYIYIRGKNQKSNVIYYKTQSTRNKREKRDEIKLEIEK